MPLAIHLLLATAMAASATRGLLAQAAQVAPASPRASRTPQVGAKKAGAEAAAAAPHEVTAADLGDPSGTEAAAATDGDVQEPEAGVLAGVPLTLGLPSRGQGGQRRRPSQPPRRPPPQTFPDGDGGEHGGEAATEV